MSGGGPSSGDGSGPDRHGMITLEDLESFSEDQPEDSGNGSLEEEGQTMEEDENPDRLLHYWQEVARGHQVEVSQGENIHIYLYLYAEMMLGELLKTKKVHANVADIHLGF